MFLLHDYDPPHVVLELKIGRFSATPRGVEAKLRPPLGRLAGFHTWHGLPFALAAVHSLVLGEDEHVLARLAHRIELSVAEMDMLDLKGEGVVPQRLDRSQLDVIEADVRVLASWASAVSDGCPLPEITGVLKSLPRMSPREIDQYVATFL